MVIILAEALGWLALAIFANSIATGTVKADVNHAGDFKNVSAPANCSNVPEGWKQNCYTENYTGWKVVGIK